MDSCIFCQIVAKKSPADIVYEDADVVAFHDVHPKTEVHLLIIPKKHIPTLNEVAEEDRLILGDLLVVAKMLAEQFKIAKDGYKLVMNCGKHAGQIVLHLHFHLLGGEHLRSIW